MVIGLAAAQAVHLVLAGDDVPHIWSRYLPLTALTVHSIIGLTQLVFKQYIFLFVVVIVYISLQWAQLHHNVRLAI